MVFEEDIKIIMTAEDKASEEVQAAAKRINDEYLKMERAHKAVGRSTILNNRELFATAKVMTTIGNIAGRVTDIYTKYNVMQIRLQDSARNLAEAQEDLRQAMLQSGPGSEDAIQAARRLADAQRENAQAAHEAKFAMAGFGLEALTTMGAIITAIPTMQRFANTMKGSKYAPFLATAGRGGAAAAAGLVAYEAFSQPGDQTGLTNMSISGTNRNKKGEESSYSVPIGEMGNDAIASFLNAISNALGFGQIAATSSDLKQQVNITVNGSDAGTIADEVARELQNLQVGQ